MDIVRAAFYMFFKSLPESKQGILLLFVSSCLLMWLAVVLIRKGISKDCRVAFLKQKAFIFEIASKYWFLLRNGERMKYNEEKVKEILFDLIKTPHVKSTNANLKQSDEIDDVKFRFDKLRYVIRFKDASTTVIKLSWISDYLDKNDKESKRLIEDALVMRAKFF